MPAQRYIVALHVDRALARKVPRRRLTSLARRTLAAHEVATPAELSIVVTDDDTLRELNRRYRATDAPADVLSFGPDGGEAFVTPPGSPRQLGEVLISYPMAQRQAEESGRSIAEELEHLLVHGNLHLLGFDHQGAAERRVMRAREEALLGRPAH